MAIFLQMAICHSFYSSLFLIKLATVFIKSCRALAAQSTTKGWANHLTHPSSPTSGRTLPSPHIRNELAPPQGANQATCYLFSLSPKAGTGAQ